MVLNTPQIALPSSRQTARGFFRPRTFVKPWYTKSLACVFGSHEFGSGTHHFEQRNPCWAPVVRAKRSPLNDPENHPARSRPGPLPGVPGHLAKAAVYFSRSNGGRQAPAPRLLGLICRPFAKQGIGIHRRKLGKYTKTLWLPVIRVLWVCSCFWWVRGGSFHTFSTLGDLGTAEF